MVASAPPPRSRARRRSAGSGRRVERRRRDRHRPERRAALRQLEDPRRRSGRASSPYGVSTWILRSRRRGDALRVAVADQRAGRAEALERRLRAVLPRELSIVRSCRSTPVTSNWLAERPCPAGAHCRRGRHGGSLRSRDGGRDVGRREAVLRGERVVGVELLLDRGLERRLEAGREHGDERDEREPDHQRRPRSGGPRAGLRSALSAASLSGRRPPIRAGPPIRPVRTRPGPIGARPSAARRRRRRRKRATARSQIGPTPRAIGFTIVGATGDPDESAGRYADREQRVPTVPRSGDAGRDPAARYRAEARAAGGSTDPSRTAAIGGTRVARIAGRSDATSVTTIPTSSETMIVRVAKTVPLFGSVDADRDEERDEPLREREAEREPADRGEHADDERLEHDRPSTWRRVAPIVRSVASSRVRWAIVIESVFAITNEPTKSAIEPEREQELLQEREERGRVASRLVFAWAAPVRPARSAAGRRGSRIAAAESGRVRLRRDRDLVELALLVEQALGGREVEDGERGAADRRDGAEPDDARRSEGTDRPLRLHADRVTDGEVLLACGRLVDRDLVAVRPVALGQSQRVERRVALRDAEAEVGRAAEDDRLAVLPISCAWPLTPPSA